jgi:aryl-alcohol dehydrogenase-like predicted oxidoreductase
MLGLGGSHIGTPDLTNTEAVRIIRSALDRGLNFMDNSWDYNEGVSEIRLGKALKEYRRKAFVMTKVDGRTSKEASRQIEQSLKRLGVDHIDLLQHHEVIRFDDADRIFAPNGAMEAFTEARKAGKIRYIGFTGGVLLKSKIVTPIECLHYALNLPTSVVITGIDSDEILEQAFEAREHSGP